MKRYVNCHVPHTHSSRRIHIQAQRWHKALWRRTVIQKSLLLRLLLKHLCPTNTHSRVREQYISCYRARVSSGSLLLEAHFRQASRSAFVFNSFSAKRSIILRPQYDTQFSYQSFRCVIVPLWSVVGSQWPCRTLPMLLCSRRIAISGA
jgi:hypothetical protein